MTSRSIVSLSLSLLLGVTAISLSSCGTRQLTVGAHEFRFEPPTRIPLHGGNADGDVDLMTSAWVLLIRDGRLYLNDEAYGPIRSEAVITLREGAVLVDGRLRPAQALTAEDHERLDLVPVRKDRLGNLELTLQPGPRGAGSTNTEGTFSNTHGLTKAYQTTPVTIDHRGRLWVRGVLHKAPPGAGTIASAKTLVIEGKRVIVDGVPWPPAGSPKYRLPRYW